MGKLRYFGALALLVGCHGYAEWPASGRFAGCYFFRFEHSDFRPQGSQERWWLGGNREEVTSRFVLSNPEVPPRKTPIFVVVDGDLSENGHHGHMGLWNRELTVRQVIEVREPREDDRCSPADS